MRRESPDLDRDEDDRDDGEELRHPGTAAQEIDPEIGPGSHPDSERGDGHDDEMTPGGRP